MNLLNNAGALGHLEKIEFFGQRTIALGRDQVGALLDGVRWYLRH
jgi:hypothetical protein